MAKKYHSRTYKIVFIRAGYSRKIPGRAGSGSRAGERLIRHRQDDFDPFKTSCGIDLLDPPPAKNGSSSYQTEIRVIGATKPHHVCPECKAAVLRLSYGRGGATQVISEEKIWEMARRYHEENMTLGEIAQELIVATSTVHKYFKDRGIPRKSKVTRDLEASRRKRIGYDWREAADISYLYESGNSVVTVAAMMGLTPGKLTRKMRLYEIPIRSLEEQKALAVKNRPPGNHLTPEGRERLRQVGYRCLAERKGVFANPRYDHFFEEDDDQLAA